MTIGLVYAMPGEIETLLTDETRTPIRTEAGVSFYQIRPHIIACCCGVSAFSEANGLPGTDIISRKVTQDTMRTVMIAITTRFNMYFAISSLPKLSFSTLFQRAFLSGE